MKKNILFGLMLLAFVAATQVLRAMNHAEETEETPGEPQRILLIGDSMLDGLSRRFQDYADANGHYLRTVIWYGSTSKHWATTKELAWHISQEHPTFIIMSLGTNEIGYHDYKTRENYVRQIVKTFGDKLNQVTRSRNMYRFLFWSLVAVHTAAIAVEIAARFIKH